MTYIAQSGRVNSYKQQFKKVFRTSRTENYGVGSSDDTLPHPECKSNLVTAESLSTNVHTPASLGFERSDQLGKLKLSLWDRAYDGLKKTDVGLVEDYEKLLSTQLQTNTSQKLCIS